MDVQVCSPIVSLAISLKIGRIPFGSIKIFLHVNSSVFALLLRGEEYSTSGNGTPSRISCFQAALTASA